MLSKVKRDFLPLFLDNGGVGGCDVGGDDNTESRDDVGSGGGGGESTEYD